MTPEQRQQVEAVFLELVGRPRADWGSLLAERCNGDDSVRQEVESLLSHAGPEDAHAGEGFLDPAELREHRGKLGLEGDLIAPSTRIAEFTILGRIGEGGMGVVYLAEQARPRRTVALKLIRRGLATQEMTRRFEHEAEVLGRLGHPGIAQIYEAGVAPTPSRVQPYIAMELIEGPPLTQYATDKSLSIADRVRLMISVCDAVQHAHQRGVIHRDLKPSNILVAGGAGGGGGEEGAQPKILDFGVAHVIESDPEQDATTLHTRVGQFIGTLAYMSPEQVLGDSSQIDTRADVYSLGVILYELIGGRLPIDVRGKSLPEAARLVREEPPARLGAADRSLRGDLETIVAKSLEKERDRRYASAAELGDELRRFLEGRPIVAKQDSAMYVVRKQVLRHRWAAAAAAGALAAVLAFAVYADMAKAAAQRQSEQLKRNLYVSAIGFAQAAYAARDADRMRRVLASCPEELRGWEWRYLKHISDTSERTEQLPLNGFASTGASSDGSRIAMWSGSRTVEVLDAATWTRVAELDAEEQVVSVALPSDGRECIAGCLNGQVRVCAIAGGAVRPSIDLHEGPVMVLAASPDGSRALTGTGVKDDRVTRLVAVGSRPNEGRIERDLGAGTTFASTFSPDGHWVAMAMEEGGVRLVNVADPSAPERRYRAHTAASRSVAFSRDGKRLAWGSHEGLVAVLDMDRAAADPSGTPPIQLVPVSDNKIFALAWNHEGTLLAASGTEPVVRVLDVGASKILATLTGHLARVDLLAWGAQSLVSTGRDGTIRWWTPPVLPAASDDQEAPALVGSPAGGAGTLSRVFHRSIGTACLDPRGKFLFIGIDPGEVMALDPADLSTKFEAHVSSSQVNCVDVSGDGSLVATANDAGDVCVLDTASHAEVSRFRCPKGRSLIVAFDRSTPDPRRLVLACDGPAATVWNPRTGKLLLELSGRDSLTSTANFSPDGSLIAVGHRDGMICLHDATSGKLLREVRGHSGLIFKIRFSADGTTACSGDDLGNILVWNTATGIVDHTLIGHQHGVFTVAFNRDATRLLSGGWDNTVRLWHVEDGQELLTLRGHLSGTNTAEFGPDGETVFSVSGDGEVRVWSAGSRRHAPASADGK